MTAFQRPLRGPGGKPVLGPDGLPKREPTYTIKFSLAGKVHWVKTGFTVQREAERFGRELLEQMKRERAPSLLAELKSRHDQTVGSVLEAYEQAGCPNANLEPRQGRALAEARARIAVASQWWARKDPAAVTAADHDDYYLWRRAHVAKGSGERSTELDLQVLSNAFTWALRRRLVNTNPFAKRRTYRTAQNITHAREFMPASGDELHRVAGAMLADPRSEALGWAYLLSALTGLRCHEVRHLRDAGTGPGSNDDRFLYLERAKGGKNPRFRLDDPDRPWVRPLLDAIRSWKRSKYPESQWLIPGRCGGQLDPGALTHSLTRVCRELGLPHRTGHGARAYYATARWGQGIDPDQIAHELGQRSGDDLVREVYGGAPPQWDGDLNNKTWLPSSARQAPAWAGRLAPSNVVALRSA